MKTILFAAAAIALLGGCNEAPEVPDQTVQQLMADVVQPTTEIYWDSVQYISDETGQHEILPETDADWQRTRDAAVKIQEFGVLLQTEGYSHDRGDDWTQISQSLVEVGKLAEQAAIERDVDKVFEVGGTIYNVCSACHQVYPPTVMQDASLAGGSAGRG